MSPEWQPDRQAALKQLDDFLPQAGDAYRRGRNHDFGPDRRGNVSALSPWVRHRLVLEQELVAAAVRAHGTDRAEKFIQEVFWRTYWKGWLELRPGVWDDYLVELRERRDALSARPELRDRLQHAENGETGIECFDAWVRELLTRGYLHNHARMWFASIWVFTLKLPWSLGADFFLRHLLDGDPASNTLSWRWVAGRQTPGKTYLARADNIARFTDRRFQPQAHELATDAPPPAGLPDHPPPTLPSPPDNADPGLRTGLFLSEEDLHPESLSGIPEVRAVAGSHCASARSAEPVSDAVLQFTNAAQADALQRAASNWNCASTQLTANIDARGILEWAARAQLEQLIIPWIPVGPARDRFGGMIRDLEAAGLRVCQLRRDWDSLCWPHARAGFFRFRKAIPQLISELVST